MLQDEPISYIREQYDDKNELLRNYGEQVSVWTFYEDIFSDLEMVMPVLIIDENEEKHMRKMSIADSIVLSQNRNDVLLGGCSYFNEFVSKGTAKSIYAFIVDMDNVYSGVLLRTLQHEWRLENGDPVPMPTYIVNSGTGLHLYFLLEKPLPCYKSQIANIDKLYRCLAEMETTKRVYLRKSVQWFGQAFRMAGGLNKYDWENTVFKVGERWDVDKLGEAVGLKDVRFLHEGEARPRTGGTKRKRIKSGQRKGYYLNQQVYKTSVERCKNETHEGTRYMSMCALSVLAYKCKVPQEQLEEDLLSLLPLYNRNAKRQIKRKEVYSAMKMYNDKAIDTPRIRSEDWLGWQFVGSRRNGRKQDVHLLIARAVRDALHPDGWQNKNGRPKGSGTKQAIVQDWREKNPDGKPKDCIRETGLSKNTVYKWWHFGLDEFVVEVVTDAVVVEESCIGDAEKLIQSAGKVGRPNGSGTAWGIVQDWRERNPDGRKVDCIRETGLSKPTVLKWWDA